MQNKRIRGGGGRKEGRKGCKEPKEGPSKQKKEREHEHSVRFAYQQEAAGAAQRPSGRPLCREREERERMSRLV